MHISHFKDVAELLAEICFDMSKSEELEYAKKIISIELALKGLANPGKRWKHIEDMKNIFWFKKATMSEYVSKHWKEVDFFGFQFLNATNPNVIKCCSERPQNFPVMDEIIKPFMETGASLKKKMKAIYFYVIGG
ncbi:hypothetical protein CHARACLAT_007244 [Characodon lateralis]|uniref:Lipoxygenase domain-containing protein n=1 Tax=Characodon lateralis TaxID=208331 RepID=A0ABU7DYG5_9TELE|nr:hypothetical protein [Characodon lateralis]